MFSSEHTLVLPSGSAAIAISNTAPAKGPSGHDGITLVFRSEYMQVPLAEGEEVILGRLHPSNSVQPQVDLSRYGAAGCGTSRLHATIRHEHGKWWIKDLGSSNGTWVNGDRLAPFAPQMLETRTHLQLGNLEFRVILPEKPLVA